jgi:RNA polymerase sigma-70 factor (ECF subfamily)
MRSLATYRGDAPVVIWLATIARHVCADDVRRRQRRRRLVDRLAAAARERHAPAPDMVDDVLAHLDGDRREAFVLTQYVGLSYEEAAVVLECPIGTIRSRVSRARSDLAAIVARSEAP